jgi:hypothetical protein
MRELSQNEREVLAHGVEDPAAWWRHCQANFNGDPEAALAAKVGRHAAAYEAARAAPGYLTKAAEAAAEAARQAVNGPSYRQRRAAAYAATLGREPGQMNAMGDCLDVILKQFNQLRLDGTPMIQEMDDLLGKVLAIKAKFPKPG